MEDKDLYHLYYPYILYRHGCGSLQLPNWRIWGLAVPLGRPNTEADTRRLIFLQNMVAGVLSHDEEKAKAYKEGKLCYYDIVLEVEAFCGRKLCGKGVA